MNIKIDVEIEVPAEEWCDYCDYLNDRTRYVRCDIYHEVLDIRDHERGTVFKCKQCLEAVASKTIDEMIRK